MMESTKTLASILAKTSSRAPLKNRIIASEMMRKRVDERNKLNKNLILNSAELHVIGSSGNGYEPALVVSSEGKSYLFNCPEGTQRYFYSNKIKLLGLENVFITQHDWNQVSGIFGLSLTLQDIGTPTLCIRSTEHVDNLFKSTRNFITYYTGMECTTKSHLDGIFEDTGIRIQPILIESKNLKISPEYDHLSDDITQTSKRQKGNSKLVAYLCTFPDLPGTLNPEKCRELKIPVGRHLATLKSGQDITLPDGRVIKSTDVCGPKHEGLNFIVLECPTKSEIENLVTNPTLETHRRFQKSSGEKQISFVVHFSPEEVTSDERYREWMNSFPKNCKHLLLCNSASGGLNFIDAYRLQYLMSIIDKEIFPAMSLSEKIIKQAEEELKRPFESRYSSDPVINEKQSTDSAVDFFAGTSDNIVEVAANDRFVIRPHKVVESLDPTLNIDSYLEEAKMSEDFDEKLEELRTLQKELPKAKDHEPEVVFLGTGSAIPGKLRNTSCILLNFQLPQKMSVIMDCGEDSYGQLHRLYGPKKSDEILKQLKLIYISHQHPDHHLGLIKLLRNRIRLTNEPVILILPPGIHHLLSHYNENFEDLSKSYEVFMSTKFKTVPSTGLINTADSDIVKTELKDKLNGFLEDITVVGVHHCINSCAIVMKFRIGHPEMDTFTVGYSGDARPSKDFILAGKNCDLLIHEATFDHRSQEDALAKKHCTSTEAISVAKQMEAKFTILTHFSSRLAKIPYFTDEFDESIGFAFDNMSIKCPSHFARIPILKPILNTVFEKSIHENDLRFIKKQAKQTVIDEILASQPSPLS